MTRTKTLIAAAVGGLAALLLVGTALAHPGGGLADKVDVLARALGITAEEVEQAKQDGALTDLLADVSRGDLREAFETEATEAIDEAVTSGDITSTQADRLKEVVTADRSDLTDSDLETLKSLRCCDRSRSRPVDRSQARPPGGRSGSCLRYSYGLPSSLCSRPPGARRACRVR